MRVLWRAARYLRPYLKYALAALAALILVNLANLAVPQLVRWLIDRGLRPLNMTAVWQAVAGLLVVALVRGVFNFLQGYWSEIASQGVAFDLRNALFAKIQSLSFSYHDQAQTGRLMTRMTSDVETIRIFFGRALVWLLGSLFMVVGAVVLLFRMNAALAWRVMFVVPVILGLFTFMVRRLMPISRRIQQELATLNTILHENILGARLVRAFAREDTERERFAAQNQILLEQHLTWVRWFTRILPLIFFTTNLAIVLVLWWGGQEHLAGRLTVGELVAFIGYLQFLTMPILNIGMVSNLMARAAASAQRVFEILDAETEVKEKPDAIPLPPIKGRVEFDHVYFRYPGSDRDVLHDITFVAEPGEIVAILGETGSGKSTIINLIPRFYDVTAGAVRIDGYDVRDVTLDSLRRQIGIVLQEPILFSGTIRENIAYGKPDATMEEIIAAAKAAQAHDFIMQLPQGYDTVIGERGVGLSGGQKQRIAIARALLVDPRILILDDSTSAVDAETEHRILQALDRLMEGRTSFVIAQRIATVQRAHKILLLHEGRLVAQGTHAELLHRSPLYVEILASQFGVRPWEVAPAAAQSSTPQPSDAEASSQS